MDSPAVNSGSGQGSASVTACDSDGRIVCDSDDGQRPRAVGSAHCAKRDRCCATD